MPDFNVRSDSVNVEQIMEQIRARIREKRGVDYTEQQIRELAAVKLEKFLDPRGVRSDLLEQFRSAQPPYAPPELPNYAFEEQTLFESHAAPLRWIRQLLQPILKLFFNPNPLIQALNIQSRLNTMYAEREARREAARHGFDQLHYEVLHNLVVETTRMGIEVKNLKMRVESLTEPARVQRAARARARKRGRLQAAPTSGAWRRRPRASVRAEAAAAASANPPTRATGSRAARAAAAEPQRRTRPAQPAAAAPARTARRRARQPPIMGGPVRRAATAAAARRRRREAESRRTAAHASRRRRRAMRWRAGLRVVRGSGRATIPSHPIDEQ